jgi:hypothetical protein
MISAAGSNAMRSVPALLWRSNVGMEILPVIGDHRRDCAAGNGLYKPLTLVLYRPR